MFTTNQIEKFLFFDIETAGSNKDLSELSPKLRELWSSRADFLRNQLSVKYPDNANRTDSELFTEKAALQAEFGRVVCISLGRVKFNDEGEPRVQIISYAGEDEANILTHAFTLINQFTAAGLKLVGHNIKRFDIPYLCKRAYINRIEPPISLQVWDKKPWEIPVVDTSDIWSFGAWQEGFSSLDLLATVLGHPSPKDEMHGSEVHSNFYNGNIQEIQKYCQKDVISVIQVILSLSNLNRLAESDIIYK